MRNAKQMAEITEAAKIEISQVILDQIEPQIMEAAKKGRNSVTIEEELGDVAVDMLKGLGYGVKQEERRSCYGYSTATTITW